MSMFKIISRTSSTTPIGILAEALRKTGNTVDHILLKKVKIIKCENGECLAEMKIGKGDCNLLDGFHGGAAAKLIDTISSFALASHDKHYMVPSVSVNLNLSYLKGTALGEEIIIDAKTSRAGKQLAYIKCEIRNKTTGDVVIEGTHVKKILDRAKTFSEMIKEFLVFILKQLRMSPKTVTAENFENYLKTSNNYDKVLNKVKVVSVGDGNCVAELKIDNEHANSMNILHGGFSAMLVDVITSFGLLTIEQYYMIPSVTVDLHLTYLKAAKVSEEIVIDARTIKSGKTLAFLECEIKRKSTGEVLVKGNQTKCFLHPK
ncbi:hypothetical protein ILUMI_23917 [Ignelater luminosus]|uniref:Acyl-coenzyme A thioesterase 13 n=1 Tax=Ignelater luminosus TaxID=2038154 RepID=A0A8K0C801_IGNLU|nr:hypothetical protein ILUMI_23917 [Ignelater luminosus]